VISRFFIDRPIFASVLSIIFVLAGIVTIRSLPIAQYPDVTPPTVVVTALYPGANSITVRDTVAAPIEEQVSGVEGMLYMSSQSTNDGAYTLTVTFRMGTDSDMAQVLVQNRVSLALPVIPLLVQNEGINVRKMSPNTLMIVNLVSERDPKTGSDRYDSLFLSNYATIYLKDELARLDGVAGITYLGQRDYSLRAWLDPDRMASLNLSAMDVVNAINQQNLQVAAGQIGQQPVPKGQQFQLAINTLGRLTEPAQFADIILKAGSASSSASTAVPTASSTAAPMTAAVLSGNASGASPRLSTGIVRLRDVAKVTLGSQQYNQTCALDGKPSVALSIFQLPGSNALNTADGVYAKMRELKERFPEGLDYRIVYDTTPFIRESVNEVFHTLRDATILVAIVVLVFLQNWRAAVIPLIAVPVAIIGTFAFMAALGYSLNNLSLFGLVLAIGIVVDDAIVVVENVERWLDEGKEPREAARQAMDEVTGPVIAVALTLCAVFIPCMFLSGIAGQFFRQFAVTIAVSTVISAFNSLTLSPALAAILLKPRNARQDWLNAGMNFVLGWFFKLFNKSFSAGSAIYMRGVSALLRISFLALLVYGGLLVLTYWRFVTAPNGFVPQQDKGYLVLDVRLPDSASLERTQEVMERIEKIARETAGVNHTLSVSGQSLILNANAPNFGSMYVLLKEFQDRRGAEGSADAIADAIETKCRAQVNDSLVKIFSPPPIDGLGASGGFKMIIEDRGDLGQEELQRLSDHIVAAGEADAGLRGLFNASRVDTPWLYLAIDRSKCMALGVRVDDVFSTLQVYFGSYYVNNFNEFGRTWQVNVQADQRFRADASELRQLQVRNNRGQMIKLATVLDIRDTGGPAIVMRYNLYSATVITGDSAPGTSSGQAIEKMERLARKTLPRSMAFDWTELTYLEIQAGNSAIYVFALAVIFVFLVLAAQYESWSLPLAVILVVPMCLLCSIVGLSLAGMEVNLFTQIGFVVLVGLASKNAILIVEFAKQQEEAGKSSKDAVLEATRLRLRPILMTSLAFILGVVPLVIAYGAGAEMRRALGLAVFSGMLGVTCFGLFLTPIFYYSIRRYGSSIRLNCLFHKSSRLPAE
jgi:multidrug efflux pump